MITTVASAWVLTYFGAAAVATARALRAMGAAPRAVRVSSCVLVRPLAGDEPGLEARLCGTGGAQRVIFAVGDSLDPAAAIARRAAFRLRARGLEASVLATHAVGPNHKTDQLARALASPRAAGSRVVVVADSDVALRDGDLARLLAPLEDPSVAAAWAAPVEQGAVTTLGDHASRAVLDASLHAFPLLGEIDRRGLVGKLFAIEREALDRVDGFGSLVTFVGEDMELARRLRASGRRTVMVRGLVARSMASGRALADVHQRYTRWVVVIRLQRPALLLSYPLLLAPAPLMLVLLAIALGTGDGSLRTVALAGLLTRLVVACVARAAAGLSFAPLTATAQAVLADLVLLAAFAAALVAPRIRWRGRTIRLASGASRRQEAREESLGQPAHAAGGARVDDRELRRDQGALERAADPRELALDGDLLEEDAARDVALGRERRAEGDPQVRVLGGPEDVAETDRHDGRAPRDAGDLRRARPQRERPVRRPLAPLGEDPERAPGAVEEASGMADGARAVGRVVEVDAERADTPEEREAPEVRGVHHGVAVTAEEQLRRVEGDESVPPRRVVRDDERGRVAQDGAHVAQPGDEHAAERALDARPRVAREPRVEPAALGGRDHQAPP